MRLLDPLKDAGAQDDAWLPDSDGNLTLPVGRNHVLWRADTLMALTDLTPLFLIPFIAPGDKIAKKLVMKSRRLSETVYRTYGRLTRYGDGGRARKAVSKFIVKQIGDALEDLPATIVEQVLDKAVGFDWRSSYLTGLDIAYNTIAQEVWVYDTVAPTLSTNKDPVTFPDPLQPLLTYDPLTDTYYLEAFAPRIPAGTVEAFAKMLLVAEDECQGSRPPLDPHRVDALSLSVWLAGDEGTLQWRVADHGPNEQGGSNLSPVVEQRFVVQDTNPPVIIAPPSRVVEIPGAVTEPLDLGSPRVFDLVDLAPEIGNDAPAGATFGIGVNTVTWTAADRSGNIASSEQLINVKLEGTNQAPQAFDQVVSAISYSPIDIILRATDPDFDPVSARHDPLTFTIRDKPAHGFFVAPLLPYFIDDYRLEASALRFEAEPDQVDPANYCDLLREGDITGPDRFQMKYPYDAEWFSVDDDGTTFVYDQGDMQCQFGDLASRYRLVAFDADGELLFKNQNDVSENIRDIYIDWRTKAVYVMDNPDPGVPNRIVFYDKTLAELGNREVEYTDSDGFSARITGDAFIATDHQGIVFVGGKGSGADAVVAYQGPVAGEPVAGASYRFLGILHEDSDMRDIAIDTKNHVYVPKRDRILKFAPSSLDENGDLVPGALIGWMGRCVANLTNTFACDVSNERSIGFSCTDALCGTDGDNFGAGPVQFSDLRGIAIDPNDILYASDYGNFRVQRFTPDGDFAGEAKSTGVGYGFILGDFGRPEGITVNSDHFYILNNRLLHVLQTTPVTPIDDGSGRVTYQSHDNYAGDDSFTFEATDGLASDTGTVTVHVERNYRPPVISVPPTYTLAGDSSIEVTLVGSDPDGAHDTLMFIVVEAPRNGTLSGSGANLVYTPGPYFHGEDSFSYVASDGVFESAPATVALTVTPVEHAPHVTTGVEVDEGLGYSFQFPVEVFDPDEDESLMVAIDWGDGSGIATSGVLMRNGVAVTGDSIDEDGTVSEDYEATGPLVQLDADGNGTVVFEHAFTASGDYEALICVSDRMVTAPDGTQTMTAGSSLTCTQTTFSVSLVTDLFLSVEADADETAPGTQRRFTVSVSGRPFDVDVPGSPGGADATDVLVFGEHGRSLAMTAISASQGSCTRAQETFSCALGTLAFDATATIDIETAVDPLAPGNAFLTVAANRSAAALDPLEEEAIGAVLVRHSGKPPAAASLSTSSGPVGGGTELVIVGADFDMDAEVLFGFIPANEFDVVDARTIAVTTPPHLAGVVDVVVVNSDDQATRLAQAFEFVAAAPGGGGGGGGDGSDSGSPPGIDDSGNPAAPAGGGGGGTMDPATAALLCALLGLLHRRRMRTALGSPHGGRAWRT